MLQVVQRALAVLMDMQRTVQRNRKKAHQQREDGAERTFREALVSRDGQGCFFSISPAGFAIWPNLAGFHAYSIGMQTPSSTTKPDLLDWLLGNRLLRTVIAAAILIQCADTLYNTGKSFLTGFREGFGAHGTARQDK
jgi:hypothetical protein